MMSEPSEQRIAIHILSNISQSKGKHLKKFGEFIYYKKSSISLQKPCRKWSIETSYSLKFCSLKEPYTIKQSRA